MSVFDVKLVPTQLFWASCIEGNNSSGSFKEKMFPLFLWVRVSLCPHMSMKNFSEYFL